MSKAFVNEDAPAETVAVRSAPRVAPGESRYITAEGFARLQAELGQAEAELAREGKGGAAGLRRADLEDRIRALTATLGAVTVVPRPPRKPDRVYFGAWVSLEDEDGGTSEVRIVGPDEVDVRAAQISVDSPMARALLGREVGDEVTVQRPLGPKRFTIARVADEHSPA